MISILPTQIKIVFDCQNALYLRYNYLIILNLPRHVFFRDFKNFYFFYDKMVIV